MPDTELLTAARSALQSGQRHAARTLLMQLVRAEPRNGEAWHLLGQVVDDPRQKADCEGRLQTVLARAMADAPSLEQAWSEFTRCPLAPEESIALAKEFVRQYPQHRYARAFQAYLEHMRIMAMLPESEHKADSPARRLLPPTLLGEYLVERGMVPREQVQRALAEQQRLRQVGVDLRLGTLLLLHGHLESTQLASALAALVRPGYGHFGAYLLERGVLTAEQLGHALARQAAIVAEQERDYTEALAAYERARGSKPLLTVLGRHTRPLKPERDPQPKLGDVLVRMGLLTPEHVERLLQDWRLEPTSDLIWE